jgi:hypothetical protein
MPWLRQLVASLSLQGTGLVPESVDVGYVKQSGTGTGFSLSSLVLPVSIIPPWLSILIYHLGDGQ